jgi:hypothetical protein
MGEQRHLSGDFGSVFINKCVVSMRAFMVPKGVLDGLTPVKNFSPQGKGSAVRDGSGLQQFATEPE